jgi:hypothetical protein
MPEMDDRLKALKKNAERRTSHRQKIRTDRLCAPKNEQGRRGIHPTSGGPFSVGHAKPTDIPQQLVALLHTNIVFGV